MSTDGVDRRKILAAIGALGVASSGVASADHGHKEENDHSDECESCGGGKKDNHQTEDTSVCTYPCGKPAERPDRPHGHEWWWDGVLTIQNCSDCTRKVEIDTSACVADEPVLEDTVVDQLPSDMTMHVPAGGRYSMWFRGTITDLDIEPANMNISITMRSEHLSNATQCKR